MIKIENTKVTGWEPAIRGMRNPMNSWERSDSKWCCCKNSPAVESVEVHKDPITDHYTCFIIGDNDADLMKRLRNAGTDHRKFMRMITVAMDVTAPLYWWKEFDTYKVGTVANSCSTMHKIHGKEFTLEDFSCEHLIQDWEDPNRHIGVVEKYTPMQRLIDTISMLNLCREKYLIAVKTKPETGLSAKDIWWQMIQLLPSSYNQRRTIMLNYEVLANIYKSRRNHKLDEWHTFCEWIENLPYSELITDEKKEP